jgi:hypothetical protein
VVSADIGSNIERRWLNEGDERRKGDENEGDER